MMFTPQATLAAVVVTPLNGDGIFSVDSGTGNSWVGVPNDASGQRYTNIDESACNNATDYVHTSTTQAVRRYFDVDLSSVPNGANVVAITLLPCVQSPNSGTKSIQVGYVWGGGATQVIHPNPINWTGTAWANSTFRVFNTSFVKQASSALQVGVIHNFPGKSINVSRLKVQLTYLD